MFDYINGILAVSRSVCNILLLLPGCHLNHTGEKIGGFPFCTRKMDWHKEGILEYFKDVKRSHMSLLI